MDANEGFGPILFLAATAALLIGAALMIVVVRS